MKKLFLMVICLFFSTTIFAHEHWIDIENFFHSIGEATKIFICSGHNFPKSSDVISKRVLHEMKIITPDGSEVTYKTEKEENCRSTEFIFDKEGVYMITFILRRPPRKEPDYCAKSIVSAGKLEKPWHTKVYTSGSLIEIIPQKDISVLKEDDELPLKIMYNGEPVKTTLQVIPDGKRALFLHTMADDVAQFKVKKGKYLVTSSYKGKGCSLTFEIRGQK